MKAWLVLHIIKVKTGTSIESSRSHTLQRPSKVLIYCLIVEKMQQKEYGSEEIQALSKSM